MRDRFDTYVEKADEMANLARSSYATMRGSERGPMCAALAGMYVQLAALEVALATQERKTAREKGLETRVRVLERLNGIHPARIGEPDDETAVAS